MRKHIFRGKGKAEGEWWYGDLTEHNGKAFIEHHMLKSDESGEYYESTISIEVDPETVGEYADAKDKKRKMIFEGDIIKTKAYGKVVNDCNVSDFDLFKVVWNNSSFAIENARRRFYLNSAKSELSFEIVGNIFDDPKLLEVQNDLS